MGYYEDVYLKRLNRYGVDFQTRIQGQREENFKRQLMKSVYYVEFEYATDDAPTQWKPLAPYECKPSQIITQLPVYPAAFIQTADSYKLNDWFAFALKNHTDLYDGTVWTFTDPDGHTFTKGQSDIEFQFAKKGTWKIKAAVAPAPGDPVTETIVTYVDVK